MILTRRGLLVDIFLTRRLLKSLAFCEFVSANFEHCLEHYFREYRACFMKKMADMYQTREA